jgi:hypothetical protein
MVTDVQVALNVALTGAVLLEGAAVRHARLVRTERARVLCLAKLEEKVPFLVGDALGGRCSARKKVVIVGIIVVEVRAVEESGS